MPWVPTIIALGFIAAGLFAPFLAPTDPYTPDLTARLQPPSGDAVFGTDALGRDLSTRLIYGARATLVVVAAGLFVGGTIGLVLGMIAGYYGGWLDAVISRTAEALLPFPPIFFGLLFAVGIGGGLPSVVGAIALVLWARIAQVIRSEVIAVRDREFVTLARIGGASDLRILTLHVLPNIAGTFVVLLSINAGFVVMMESILSFLGAGIPPPTPSWGNMISQGQDHVSQAWWISVVPGIAVTLTVVAFNGIGDWIREQLDPKLRDQL